ncbi:sensor histidine kinase [Halalkalirubrum salinum]|uniref:sensor histidine kinase n=1 Tax=Halalkalirubrum salinum TaxID=2563889 RepID=UPI0010FAF999|nr:ATP-binding protein [Halalkalirubrum salinum]
MSLHDDAYRALFEQSSDPLVVFDPNTGEVRERNRRFDTLCGDEEGNMGPTSIESLFSDNAGDGNVLTTLRAAASDAESITVSLETASGAMQVDTALSTVQTAKDSLAIARICSQSPCAARGKLKSQVVDHVPIGILRTKLSDLKSVEYANPTAQSLFAVDSVATLRDRGIDTFYLEPSRREKVTELVERGRERVRYEAVIQTMAGDTKDVIVTGLLVTDDTGAEYCYEVFQDATRRKEYEKQLRRQRDNLEILNEMVRHDIRNDLQLVTAYANMVADHVDEEAHSYVEIIQKYATHAVELTQTARDMADVMLSTESDHKPIDLWSTLEGELDAIRAEYPNAAITVEETTGETTVIADEMLDSVFRNLLSNAIQHNDKKVPTVTVSATRTDGSVQVTIADNGPGIPDDQKEDIFGKGEKGLESAGTGIGLYLVKSLTELYGGTVWVEDNDPAGSVFVVELPIADADDRERR